MPSSGSCSTATCRSRRWRSSPHRRTKLRPGRSRHDGTRQIAGRVTRTTDCTVDGTYAQRSTGASRSSPEAASRCAEGAGLDGGDRGRSTIKRAVLRSQVHQVDRPIGTSAIPEIHTTLTDVTVRLSNDGILRDTETTADLRGRAPRFPFPPQALGQASSRDPRFSPVFPRIWLILWCVRPNSSATAFIGTPLAARSMIAALRR